MERHLIGEHISESVDTIDAHALPKELGEGWIAMARLESDANAAAILPEVVDESLHAGRCSGTPAVAAPHAHHVSRRQCRRWQPVVPFNLEQHQMHPT